MYSVVVVVAVVVVRLYEFSLINFFVKFAYIHKRAFTKMSIQLCFAPKWYSYDKVTERKKNRRRSRENHYKPDNNNGKHFENDTQTDSFEWNYFEWRGLVSSHSSGFC